VKSCFHYSGRVYPRAKAGLSLVASQQGLVKGLCRLRVRVVGVASIIK